MTLGFSRRAWRDAASFRKPVLGGRRTPGSHTSTTRGARKIAHPLRRRLDPLPRVADTRVRTGGPLSKQPRRGGRSSEGAEALFRVACVPDRSGPFKGSGGDANRLSAIGRRAIFVNCAEPDSGHVSVTEGPCPGRGRAGMSSRFLAVMAWFGMEFKPNFCGNGSMVRDAQTTGRHRRASQEPSEGVGTPSAATSLGRTGATGSFIYRPACVFT